ncbi:MAG: DNA polymerase (family 10) [Roseivirga sp.]
MDNNTILKQLKLLAALMELHDENSFKIRGYQNAIFNLDKTDVELGGLSLDALEKIDGIGKSIAKTISEINSVGISSILQEYLNTTPEGIVELLDIKGIGPKKIKVLWKELGIESGHELKEAANAGLVAKLKGFGDKTQQTIINALEFKEANANKLHYAEAEKLVVEIIAQLKEIQPEMLCEATGEIRRKMEVIELIDILIGLDDIDELEEALDESEDFDQVLELSGPITWRGHFKQFRIPVQFSYCDKKAFVTEQFLRTGNALHINEIVKDNLSLKDLVKQGNFSNETEIYRAANFAFIAPEMREGTFEIEAVKNGALPNLVEMKDLKGILHNHSTYSDGRHSLEQMAVHCKNLGYEYLGICDHSKSAFYANGLKEDRLIQQHAEIDELNKKLAPFKIFKGIESDILYDGNLDYDDQVLDSFDFIVASVHSILNMKIEKATQRLLTAIENPYTTILGHPTGRLLLRREGYPIDHKAVIDHCAKYNVVIEINANPWRLDLDWRWVHYAIEQGVKLSINPDAHKMEGYDDMYYGLLAGRKGGLSAAMTFNALNAQEIGEYFTERKSKIKVNG